MEFSWMMRMDPPALRMHPQGSLDTMIIILYTIARQTAPGPVTVSLSPPAAFSKLQYVACVVVARLHLGLERRRSHLALLPRW